MQVIRQRTAGGKLTRLRKWLKWARQTFVSVSPVGPQPQVLTRGHICFQTLVAAARLNLFTFLNASPDASLEQIAAGLSIPTRSARTLLLACASLGLVRKRAQRYSNSRWSETHLVKDRPDNILSLLDVYHSITYQPFFHLTESLQQGTNTGLSQLPGRGTTLYERLADYPELAQVFYSALAVNQVPAAAIAALADRRHLVDMGGGDADNAIRVARRYPDLKITIFDLASTCELANQRIEEAGLTERISVQAGDFFADPLPADIDAIIFGHIFNIYSEQANQALLHKSAEGLPSGGKVVIYNMVCDDDETGPLSAAIASLYFLVVATGEGMVYPEKDYERWFTDAGFERLSIQREGDEGIFVGTR